jgi:hypothetical protein
MIRRSVAISFFVVVAGVALITFPYGAWHFGNRMYRDRQIYAAMSRECHPIWQELYSGRIHAGQSVDEVIALTRPIRVDMFENYAVLNYQHSGDGGLCFSGVTIVARDRNLISGEAWSCTWNRPFFKQWSPGEEGAFWKRYDSHRALVLRSEADGN